MVWYIFTDEGDRVSELTYEDDTEPVEGFRYERMVEKTNI